MADQEPQEAPREGTLAWLLTRPLVDVQGLALPDVHRIRDGATIQLGDDDGHCRMIRPDGQRCRAIRLRNFGVCIVHAGGGGMLDPAAMSARANAVKIRRKEQRELLGIGSRRAASARQIARVQAMERAQAMADAIVSAPLDDPNLGTIERQIAALRALDATFPLSTASVEVTIPADVEQASSMGWAEMRQLAASLLQDAS